MRAIDKIVQKCINCREENVNVCVRSFIVYGSPSPAHSAPPPPPSATCQRRRAVSLRQLSAPHRDKIAQSSKAAGGGARAGPGGTIHNNNQIRPHHFRATSLQFTPVSNNDPAGMGMSCPTAHNITNAENIDHMTCRGPILETQRKKCIRGWAQLG